MPTDDEPTAPRAPDASDAETDRPSTSVPTRTKVLWILGAAVGGWFVVSGVLGMLQG